MNSIPRLALGSLVAVVMACGTTANAAAPKDLGKKLILANPDKHLVGIKLGETKRTIQPGKASVLTPKKYPVSFEFWSGKNELGWSKTNVDGPGVYVFRWEGGKWSLNKKQPAAKKSAKPTSAKPKSTTSVQRSTGSYARTARPPVVRRPVRRPTYRPHWVGSRYPFWTRGVWGLMRLYQFIRDEEDRDILREILIEGEIDDAIREELEDWLDDRLEAVPYAERRELERAIDDIARLDGDDWREITTLPADQWDRLREDIGGDFSDADWKGLGDWADTMDEPIGDNVNLHDVGIEMMDENIDLRILASTAENLDLDMGAGADSLDMSDLAGSADSLDLSDFGGDNYQGGIDLSDLNLGPGDMGLGGTDAGNLDLGDTGISDIADGNLDNLDAGNFGGSDMATGDWGGGGFDMSPGDYNGGGFDDIGGGWGDGGGGDFGGDWGGGDFGGGAWSGGDWGGDFGGGDFGGGDFGGGDFGGGDFGGGDFGGDFF